MQKSISFRIDDDKLHLLDQLAVSQDCDRSFLLNEAVDDYLEVQQWQLAGIDQAIADADAGQFASEAEVKAAFDAFKRPPSA